MTPSIYVNLEDDVSKIVDRLKKEKPSDVTLVCPKRCFLFNDSINLRLLKKQVDLMNKNVSILTMDERGQMYAKEAGFNLKFLSKTVKAKTISDICFIRHKPSKQELEKETESERPGLISHTVKEIKNIAKLFGKETIGPIEKFSSAKSAVFTPKVVVKDNVFPAELSRAYKLEKKKFFSYKFTLFLVLLSVILVLVVFFIVLPKAEVLIYPKSENLVRDMEITMSTNVKAPDPNRLVLPATKLVETAELKDKFQSQGKKEVGNKATGTVQIYNFTRSILNLRANTTVLQVGNKSYYLTADAMQIKPTGYKNVKTKEIDEATLNAPLEIIAAEGGESYNLPAGTRLEITNRVFGSKPQLLYAKNDSSIAGGTSRYLSVISEKDISNAQKRLTDSSINLIREKLKKDNLILIDKAYQTELIQFTTDKSAGMESPSFEAYIKIKVSGLAFNPQELEKLAFDRINQTLSANKSLQTDKQEQISFEIKNLEMNNELAVLFLHFQGLAFYDVNLENITLELIGKTAEEANKLFSSKNGIERIDILLAPSWQKKFPWLSSKINLKVEK